MTRITKTSTAASGSERATRTGAERVEWWRPAGGRIAKNQNVAAGQTTHEVIQRGIPYSALESFLAVSQLPQRDVLTVADISPRTLQRRKAEGRLTPVESDRLWRVTHLYRLTVEMFEGSFSDATKWLTSPCRGLGGRTPLEFAQTEAGAREVENLIGRLEHGVIS